MYPRDIIFCVIFIVPDSL
jgi:MATE family multidrug resistance protein